MNDLNMVDAHNAELKSIGSPSGLACDAPTSPAERTLVAEFQRIMNDVGQHETEFPRYGMAGAEKTLGEEFRRIMDDVSQHENGFPMKGMTGAEKTPVDEFRPVLGEVGQQENEFPKRGMAGAEKTLGDEFRRIMDDVIQHENGLPKRGMAGNGTPHDILTAQTDREPIIPLETLFSMRPGVSSPAVTQAGACYPPLSPDALETLVDRILVSSAELGRAEVRLTLSDRVLEGTEIHLRRAPDGQLIVSLHCTSETSFQTLVASQMDLRERLEDFENRSVQLSVDIDREGGEADRRSRGYIAPDEQEPEPSNA